ncbi:ABC transporter permease [Brachyspira hyodysenteriae]|uniref:ABC transporter permease n=1 Tax=Brachyspira hyodysenteriae TaxID=159 RepID=UPI0022CD71E9|nr:ABC transporter permease [Brachyspira hyodysenteriae]MCZ9877364.1 ABC transporter permease [Brachyspira hyodysenteriae]MCZ9899019.1 ABC transporter permease [Brachyspira hyodysenteriae]
MINLILLKKEFKSNLKILLIFAAVLTMYGAIIISMFDPKLVDSLNSMVESMPQMFALFGMNNFSNNLTDFLIDYLYSFLLIIFPLVFIVLLVNRLVIRYIDKGNLFATPNSRIKIISTQILNAVIEIFILNLYITMLIIFTSEIMFKGELDITKIIIINIGLFALWLSFLGICFLSSVSFSSSSISLWAGAGLCILFMLFQMISRVGEKAEFFKYLSIITLFNPSKYSDDFNIFLTGTICLFIIGIVTNILSVIIFNKRDISA